MKRLTDLEYLQLNKWKAFWYNFALFFCGIPGWFKKLGLKIWGFIKDCGLAFRDEVVEIFSTFKKGNWAVKLSFLVFGMGNFYYGQILRGILFLFFEVVFIVYMVVPTGGAHWLAKCNWFQYGKTVGTEQGRLEYSEVFDTDVWVPGDDSVKVLLYGLLTVLFIVALVVTWRMNVKQCTLCMDITSRGKKVKSGKQDLQSLVDDQFHKTLLTPSLLGIAMFTVLPIIFMVLIAFTSYDAAHDGYSNLFTWVGLDNFNAMFNFGEGGMGLAFGEILSWTLMWAFFATFSNYFLGMFVAIMINKKGIKIKKFWRTVLVMTIAIPQFVSLMYVGKMFNCDGILGGLINNIFNKPLNFSLWDNPTSAKILVIVLNIWIGIPYVMLMATGILMNIPADLYESAKIDGASPIQQYSKITLPYMMFVMGPYLLTNFVGNLNNFNVIYLLTGGNPLNTQLGTPGGVAVGHTDLLITWLFKMTLSSAEQEYYSASVIGIMIFVVVALLSLVVYNIMPSTTGEEDFR